MKSKTSVLPVLMLLAVCACLPVGGVSQNVTAICTPKILADTVVATAAQRAAAGAIAEPPITDHANGFAWPDTPLGVIKTANGYEFFGSDGAFHARQWWNGHWYGNNKYGSITTSVGTLDNPLGSAPPIDVTISPNSDPGVNPAYSSYDYIGGGPVYQVPSGQSGAGNLLMVYHDPDRPSVYVDFVGMGSDPSVLGNGFYIFYTRHPRNGEGWPSATVHRFTVSCP